MKGIFSELDQGLPNCTGRDKINGEGGDNKKRREQKTDGQRENRTPHKVYIGIVESASMGDAFW